MNSIKTELIHDTDGRMLAFRNLGNLSIKPGNGEAKLLKSYIEQSYDGFDAGVYGISKEEYFRLRLEAISQPVPGVTRRIAQFGVSSLAGLIQPEATSITRLQYDGLGRHTLAIKALDTRAGQITRREDLPAEQHDYEKLAAGLLCLELEKVNNRVRGIPYVSVKLLADSPDITWYESLGLRPDGESEDGDVIDYGIASVKKVHEKLVNAYPVLQNLSA
ncbi:hypothetical protein BH10PAT3_BH10PAT3_4520 [soil metagenome]